MVLLKNILNNSPAASLTAQKLPQNVCCTEYCLISDLALSTCPETHTKTHQQQTLNQFPLLFVPNCNSIYKTSIITWAGTLQFALLACQICFSSAAAWSNCPLIAFATAMLYCITMWQLASVFGNHSATIKRGSNLPRQCHHRILLGGGFALTCSSSLLDTVSSGGKSKDMSFTFSRFKWSSASLILSRSTRDSAAYKWPKSLQNEIQFVSSSLY